MSNESSYQIIDSSPLPTITEIRKKFKINDSEDKTTGGKLYFN